MHCKLLAGETTRPGRLSSHLLDERTGISDTTDSLASSFISQIVESGLTSAHDIARLFQLFTREILLSAETINRYFPEPRVTIFGSARMQPDQVEYQMAVEIAHKLAEHGYAVITGAGPGIMEAGHKGARMVGPSSCVGLKIKLPFEAVHNQYIKGLPGDLSFDTFFCRKLVFIKYCNAVFAFPGGIGTMDELFETLQLLQVGHSPIVPLVLVEREGSGYWSGLYDFFEKGLLAQRMISPLDMRLFKIVNSVDDAVNEVLTFYKRFSSITYLNGNGHKAMLRLKDGLTTEQLETLKTEFSHIFPTETMTLRTTSYASKDPYQLHLNFDGKNYAGLRVLIDRINSF